MKMTIGNLMKEGVPSNPLLAMFLPSASDVDFAGNELLKENDVIPNYPFGCKRALISDEWFSCLKMENVTLDSNPIAKIVPEGIQTKDGTTHQFDVLIYGTGFETNTFVSPMEVTGVQGKKLSEVWGNSPYAYLGLTVPGFPNMFMCYGPNTNLGHNSIIFMIECQVENFLALIQDLTSQKGAAIEVKQSTVEEFYDKADKAMEKTVWAGDCSSWYKTKDGKVVNNLPFSCVKYWDMTRVHDMSKYSIKLD